MQNQRKLKELQLRATPINYSSVSVDEFGVLKERESLLDKRIVEGYGCIWLHKNEHQERVHKGAYKKSIESYGPGTNSNYQIKLRNEHGQVCALFEELREDDTGLYFRSKPLDAVPWCDHLLIQLRSKSINNFSNGFKYIWDRMEYNEDEDSIDIFEARLLEISAAGIPSDLETFAKRNQDEESFLLEEIEEFIKDVPKSKQLEARKLFTRCMAPKLITPLEGMQTRKAPDESTPPTKKVLDINYLLSKF